MRKLTELDPLDDYRRKAKREALTAWDEAVYRSRLARGWIAPSVDNPVAELVAELVAIGANVKLLIAFPGVPEFASPARVAEGG